MSQNNPKPTTLPKISSDYKEKVNFFLVNILRSLSTDEMKILNESISARILFAPPRSEKEEAERLVNEHAESQELYRELTDYKQAKESAIFDQQNTITALQLRGLDTSFEEKVLTILKGK